MHNIKAYPGHIKHQLVCEVYTYNVHEKDCSTAWEASYSLSAADAATGFSLVAAALPPLPAFACSCCSCSRANTAADLPKSALPLLCLSAAARLPAAASVAASASDLRPAMGASPPCDTARARFSSSLRSRSALVACFRLALRRLRSSRVISPSACGAPSACCLYTSSARLMDAALTMTGAASSIRIAATSDLTLMSSTTGLGAKWKRVRESSLATRAWNSILAS
mmetsp:Transcript_36839/g.81935  ORF Transcript_36839/g.81935 Transcript_36839/m.81935 type:complete len:225 (-) Transcript_36839:463-1137(-)